MFVSLCNNGMEHEIFYDLGLFTLLSVSVYFYRYFATGSADALVSLWDLEELVCVRTFSRLE